ncbi:MAG TPA: FtsX-like permease family protein [Allosphingosinicella sp.]|jgi:putative ABC transport system permease protein
MWRNYLTVALRVLTKRKTYAFINVFGLALGLAACLLILLYVRHELSYDRWLPGADRIFQLQSNLESPTGEERRIQLANYPVGAALKKDFPQIERLVHLQSGSSVILHRGEARYPDGLYFVDGPVFDVLPMPLARGDAATALSLPGSIVLTQTAAESFFGRDDPIGQTITIKSAAPGGDSTIDYRVTAILEDLPTSSHLDFKMLARFDAASPPPNVAFSVNPGAWDMISGFTYLTLRPGADPSPIHAALPEWQKKVVPRQPGAQEPPLGRQDWRLVNVKDVHLSDAQTPLKPGIERGTLVTFTIIAALVLGMACINFTNLATAGASRRAREVALRKLVGASRRQLIAQFMGETLLLVAVATFLALTAVELVLPVLSSFLGADLALSYLGADSLIPPVLGLMLLVALVGGLYPAFYLSRFQPARVLKANASTSEAPGSGRLRTALVVGQFAVSIGLIVCTAIVYSQTVYARTVDPGFDRSGLLQLESIHLLGTEGEAFRREVERVRGVTSASRTSIGVSTGMFNFSTFTLPGFDKPLEFGVYPVEAGFFEAMRIPLLAGRLFDESRPADETPASLEPAAASGPAPRSERPIHVVANESAVRALGYRSPRAAVGKQFRDISAPEPGPPHVIIGVVRDSRFRSVRDKVEPILHSFERGSLPYLVARYEGADPVAVRKQVESIWKRFAPEVPFKADFSEEVIGKLYEDEEKRGQLFAAFTLVSVLIACLGLFGLASFTAQRRTKEIGIRKVLGARVHHIVRLLAWQFSKPVIVANLIAWPVAWWAMRDWLNGFDSRIGLGPGPFVLAGIMAFAIAIGTVALHAIRVARANPILALRYE